MPDVERDELRTIVRELMVELLAEGVVAADTVPTQSGSAATRVMTSTDLHKLRTKAIEHRTTHLQANPGTVPGTTCAMDSLGTVIRLGAETLAGAEWIALESAIVDLPSDRKHIVVLDCADVRKVGSLGVGRLIVLHDALKDTNGLLAMINVTNPVAIVLRMMAVHSLLHASSGGLDQLIGTLSTEGTR